MTASPMPPAVTMHEMDGRPEETSTALVTIWNATSSDEFSMTERFMTYNLQPPAGGAVRAWLARVGETPVGFAVASHLSERPSVALPTTGWIGALAVLREHQNGGIGTQLLHTAEAWLREQGASQLMLGGDLRPFMPGVPLALQSSSFFVQRGYSLTRNGDRDGIVWDVATDLSHYAPPASVVEVEGAVRPAQPGEEALLLDFLRREFPGRWHYEAREFIRERGRISDWMLLWTASGVEGFCALTFEDSRRPIERFYPYGLPRPWGQLGPIGVSRSLRGQGFGGAVLDAGLRRLHDNGIKGCVIDWTTLLDFYGKFGFAPYHAYQQMGKSI